MNKIKKYLNKLVKYKNSIKLLHERIKQINIEDSSKNPYQVCLSWLLETLTFGLLITIVLNVLIGWQGYKNFAYPVGLGILRWLLINFRNEMR